MPQLTLGLPDQAWSADKAEERGKLFLPFSATCRG
jgi:hypothetical protein